MTILFAFLWLSSGIEAVNCGRYSSNPYSMNCMIEISDKDPTHNHLITITLSDGMNIRVNFKGPLYYVRMPTPANGQGVAITPISVKLAGKLLAKKLPAERAPAEAPVGIPVPVP